jgi:hypothetical protein
LAVFRILRPGCFVTIKNEMLTGGVQEVLLDNMNAAVDKLDKDKERDVNAYPEAMGGRHRHKGEFCNRAPARKKRNIEKNLQDRRRQNLSIQLIIVFHVNEVRQLSCVDSCGVLRESKPRAWG